MIRTTLANGYGPTTDFGAMVHAMKYRGPEESFDDYCVRYARTTTDNEKDFRILLRLLRDQVVLPAGRQQIAVGRAHSITAFNCFVANAIGDDTRAIFEAVRDGALVLRTGGGCGWDFSTIRPAGEPIRGLGLGAMASGPVSFMHCWDSMCGTIMSAGERRGAMMGVLRVDHPDVLKFVRAKQDGSSLTNFNISVAVTDAFMEALVCDGLYEMRWGDQRYGTCRAADVWGPIMESNWDFAEPGILFIDRINRLNPLRYCEEIRATNPCFAAGTLIATDRGAFPIEQLVGKSVNVHDGSRWREVDNFRVTGRYQKMVKVTLHDGSELRVTPKHTMILEDGSRKEAGQLISGDNLMVSDQRYDGDLHEEGAYLKGFLLGDGNVKRDYAVLWVYGPKDGCRERLRQSCAEIDAGALNTNAISEIGYVPVRDGCVAMTGLTPRKADLLEWVTSAKVGLPQRAYRWNWRSKVEFIAGLLDSDGTATETTNGFMYQLSSTSKRLLLDVQTLLKTIGVRSKLSLARKATQKTFDDKEYDCADLWRLTVSQTASIELANQVNFERLRSFSDRTTAYTLKSRMGRVVSVEEDGVDEVVYCCTVPGTHAVSLGIGIVTGQCAEQPLPPNGACLLGSVNVFKLLSPVRGNGDHVHDGRQHVEYGLDMELLEIAVDAMVMAFDRVIDRTVYPLPAMETEAKAKRRMGVGVTGVANALEVMGHGYGSENYILEQGKLLEAINSQAYRTSCRLAQERGKFPLWDDVYCDGEFFKRLPGDLRYEIERQGLRNGLLTSIAPTGTISLAADNISSGIEPPFQHRYERDILTPDGKRTYEVIDAAFNQYGVAGLTAEQVQPETHVDVLCAAQRWVDSSISKTINVWGQVGGEGRGATYSDFKNLYLLAWEGGAKGCTTFNANGKRGGVLRKLEDDEQKEGAACIFDLATGARSCE